MSYENIDLLVDFKLISDSTPDYSSAYARVPMPHLWRCLIFAGGIWPENLTGFAANDRYDLKRAEWIAWQSLLQGSSSTSRLPAFADYTITHPDFTKEPPEFSNPSASIRYTSDEKYIILRGEGLKNPSGPSNEQYLGWAEVLVDLDEYRNCGANFSSGDRYIWERSQDGKKPRGAKDRHPGNPTTWLRTGINHHITFVLDRLATLAAA